MIDFIFFTLFIIVFFILIYKNIKLNMRLSATRAEVLLLSINNTILSDKLAESLNNTANNSEDTSAAFLKFISDSRDWAYQYIEDVQSELNKFIIDIEPDISYFDEYGIVGSAYPHYESMKKISESFKKLKKLLPEDYGKIV